MGIPMLPWDPARNVKSGLILGLHPANERRHYKVTLSLIGWAQTQNQRCKWNDHQTYRMELKVVL